MTSGLFSRVATVVLAGVAGAVAIDFYLIATQSWILHNASAMAISQWDASNVLGAGAFDGGWQTAAAGFGIHCIVSICWATIFAILFWRVPFVRRQPVLAGALFGVVVMFVMRYGVVPLGHAVELRAGPVRMLSLLIAHTLFFGIPVALVVRAVSMRVRDAVATY